MYKSESKNKSFGYLFTLIFLFLGLYCFFQEFPIYIGLTLFIGALLFFITTIFLPKKLTKLNQLWLALGQMLGKIFSPIILGIIYYLFITPVAIMTRLFGRDELRLKKNENNSYWINREGGKPSTESFKNQF